ncbi:hypothetical protein HK103_004653 [Boothiomyces macroporosus]|uniref:Ankyrin repeat protein n=1 Tax=Boothiomyces macroporosus TaxID=261099 RepID=A0AAD5UMW9_9FUNG|nr:hypothetical protein HK103_004653 [Boothiomyces macroporosus]
MTDLIEAAFEGDLKKVQILVQNGENLNTRDHRFTPLQQAASNGHYDIVKYMLESGVDINQLAKNGMTALHLACINGDNQMAHLLLEKGIKINIKGNEGLNALHWAIIREHWHTAALLIDYGIKIEKYCSYSTEYYSMFKPYLAILKVHCYQLIGNLLMHDLDLPFDIADIVLGYIGRPQYVDNLPYLNEKQLRTLMFQYRYPDCFH